MLLYIQNFNQAKPKTKQQSLYKHEQERPIVIIVQRLHVTMYRDQFTKISKSGKRSPPKAQ